MEVLLVVDGKAVRSGGTWICEGRAKGLDSEAQGLAPSSGGGGRAEDADEDDGVVVGAAVEVEDATGADERLPCEREASAGDGFDALGNGIG